MKPIRNYLEFCKSREKLKFFGGSLLVPFDFLKRERVLKCLKFNGFSRFIRLVKLGVVCESEKKKAFAIALKSFSSWWVKRENGSILENYERGPFFSTV